LSRGWINRSEQILLSQQPHRRGDDRERINRARQTAEALFTPKRQVTEQLVSGFPPADQSARKPRVLGISPSAPTRLTEGKAPVIPEPQMPREVLRSQFPRIRSWVKYGMTAAQVAEVYGVAVDDIERILRKA
jgi:hypothetical protein